MIQNIQWLRAVAVLGVVCYHLGFPQISGGFFGVDVFFVISGYVICASVLRQVSEDGHFNLGLFLHRRFWRLFPALAVVLTVVMLASVLFLPTASEVNWLAGTAIAAAASAGNIPIAVNSEDYFGSESAENLLLHVWSLGVEGQFYFLTAAIFWYLSPKSSTLKLGARSFRYLLWFGLIAVTSFFAFFFVEQIRSSIPYGQAIFSFYSPLPRFWEFFSGAAIALARLKGPTSTSLARAISTTGYSLILISFFSSLEPSAELSKLALVPVCGATLVVYSSLSNPKPPRSLGRVLSALGDLSYSWYLWHWPFIAIGYMYSPGNRLLGAWLALISLVTACVTYVGVEKPLRQRALGRRQPTFRPLAIGLSGVITVSLGSALLFSTTVAPLNSATALDGNLGWVDVNKEISENFPECQSFDHCIQSHAEREPEVLVLGASHAKHLLIGLRETFPDTVFAHIEKSESVYAGPNKQMLDEIRRSQSIRVVIIGEPFLRPNYDFDWDALKRSSQTLASSEKRVLVADGTPSLEVPLSLCKSQSLLGRFRDGCVFSSEHNDTRYLRTRIQLDAVEQNSSYIDIVPTYQLFCSEGVCSAASGRAVYFADKDHLGRYGSIHAASAFLRYLGETGR